MLGVKCGVRLPLTFDVEPLLRDLETAERHEFSAHPLRYHDGNWTAINLIYGGGKTEYTHEGDYGYGDGAPESTEVLDECKYFQEVLAAFPGEIKMARLSAIAPGGRILRHYDPIESVDHGNLRIHIPIRSDPRLVVFHLGFGRQRWRPGETWYGDFTFPHSVHNKAPYTRVNMIIDVGITDEYKALFPEDYFAPATVRRREWLRQETRSISWRIGLVEEWVRSRWRGHSVGT